MSDGRAEPIRVRVRQDLCPVGGVRRVGAMAMTRSPGGAGNLTLWVVSLCRALISKRCDESGPAATARLSQAHSQGSAQRAFGRGTTRGRLSGGDSLTFLTPDGLRRVGR